ncbi:MAG: gluconate 2-dehydrogenase subunit 3 family protein [Flavisolibacter sp.]|nr:gluconate 2-dehydrogenase subunit 3 family protein [Flavisolibacter sp.]
MNRRDAVQHLALLLGGSLVGANAFLTGCKTHTGKDQAWDADDIAYLDEIAETILPATSTPGAKAAKVGQFMTVMVNDCYEEKDQKVFREGMDKLNDAADKKYNSKFMKLSPQQRHDLLVQLDKEQKDYTKNKKKDDPAHYFRMMKELTMLGYFTSEIGTKVARRYVPVPGRFDGCIPYKKGDKAFAP